MVEINRNLAAAVVIETDKEAVHPVNEAGDDRDCPICFDKILPLDSGEVTQGRCEVYRHQCGREFHATCIHTWLDAEISEDCPMCRLPLDIQRSQFKMQSDQTLNDDQLYSPGAQPATQGIQPPQTHEARDQEARVSLLKSFAEAVSRDQNIDFDEFGPQTAGFNAKDLDNVIQASVFHANRNGRKYICTMDIQRAIRDIKPH